MRAILTALLLLLPALAASLPAAAGPTERGRPVEVEAAPVEVPGEYHRTVRPLGAWALDSADPAFGGLSGLLVEGGRLTAVTDRGQWLTARLAREGDRLAPARARMAPMRGPDGSALTGAGRDAEGLARLGGTLHVSFERDHRIMRHAGAGRLSEGTRARAFDALAGNAGLEGLAALPGGALLAIAEGAGDGGFPMWRLEPGGTLRRALLPRPSRHAVTGADLAPDGRLLVLFRHFSPLAGVSIRLRAYPIGAEGWPDPAGMTELAAWQGLSGIDNMEAVAAAPDGAGGTVIWILSDDNFNFPQRTLLVALALGP